MADQARHVVLADIYARHRQGLFTLALAITRSRQSADDAVHDAFVRLCRRQLTADDPVAYVFAAVRNAARDLATRRKTGELPLDLFDARPGPLAQAQSVEMGEAVRNGLAELEPQQREAIVMKIYADLTFEQIAAISGEPLQTIASRYRRALLKLKELMLTTRP